MPFQLILIMKNLFILIIFFSLNSKGQNKGRVEYLVSTDFAFQYSTLGILEFKNMGSKFIILPSQKANKSADISSESNHMTIKMPEPKSRPTNYINLSDSLIYSNVPLFKSSNTIGEKLPIINWQIKNEFKPVNKFKCQKAVGYFRGRTYTVWFTNQIPLPFGPWKLQGLPGLILEVKDAENEVYFKASKISFRDISEISFPEKESAINLKEYITKILPDKYKELEAYANAKSKSRNTSVTLSLPNRYHAREIIYEWEEKENKDD